MAKYTIKGKKVTGTKNKDKITWQNKKVWKKNLTVYGLNGNDTIDFSKSNKSNIFYGGKGNDVIKTGTGKKNTIIINKGDGNDTIYTKGKATLVQFNSSSKSDKMAFSKSGKDLILSYTYAKTKKPQIITFKNYFNTDGTVWKQNISIKQAKSTKTMDALLNQYGITMTSQKPNDIIQGTPYKDTITGSTFNGDKIYGGANNDLIKGNFSDKGTKYIDGGDGNDTIYGADGNYNTNTILGGNGDDFIYNGGTNSTTKNIIDAGAGNDTIHFSDGTNNVNANDGDDKIFVEGGLNTINGGAGTNEIHINRPMFYTDFDNTVEKGGGTDILFLDNLNSFDDAVVEYNGDDLKVFDGTDWVVLKDFKNGHSVQYVNIKGQQKSINEIPVQFSGTDADDTISTGNYDILNGGKGADTYEFECGQWYTVFTAEDIKHYTIVMGNDNKQDTINILTDKNSNGILLRKNGNNLVIWYKQQYYPGDNPDNTLDDGIYQIDGKDTFVYNHDRYFASITVKNYFTAENPTIDKIVMGIPGSGEPNEYSITSLYRGEADLENWEEADYDGTYDQENRTYYGTKYNDYINTKRGSEDGDIVYSGAGNDTIYTWGRSDSVYAEAGNDSILGNSNCKILDGGTGNDEISVSASSGYSNEFITIYGGEGSDNISVYKGRVKIYTNSETGGKDTTEGIIDRITINTSAYDSPTKIYAQSETNIIVNNNDFGDDDYFAYINQKTFITEAHGADEDSLTIIDAAHNDLHIAFNMRNKNTGIEDDTLWILDDANYTKWQANMNDTTIKGINIKGDDICKIERINASDGYYLGQTQLMQLESEVSNWLNSYNPSGYTYVSDVLASENKDALITLIANNTNWQTT